MQQNTTHDFVRTIYVDPCVAGLHLDYSLGEELPLFGPMIDETLVYGVGYNSIERRRALGLPYHETTSRAHERWRYMLDRCYGSDAPAYEGCTVCKKWRDFQEFAYWFVAQPYANAVDMELDKDILDPLNTVYSPEYCSLVPRMINQMFRNTRSQRGILPIGVTLGPRRTGFVARISKYGKSVYLGKFNDIIKAFDAYKAAHSAYCNELADEYEGRIDPRVLERLRRCYRHIHD
ncbi:hypothetical protein [Pseudomonas coleopterorum]|jgi:hypothetical protein|uniref:hypothetical protein n=1 Tax=Pseudomonas coleopterorum TaxID=1605838 RepID=UPI0017808659|nr:hypothetical protein [Pseudomonas coleopterorum]MBD8482503.1 hypothetical protein [Pseudomonas coleopterorum]